VPVNGSSLTGPPAGAQLCPGGADSATLTSPYTTSAQVQAAFPANGAPVVLAAGDNSGQIGQNYLVAANTTYYFAAGTHTLGSGQYSQIMPKSGDVFVGAPGAIISGQGVNEYAFTGTATNVTIEYLTVTGFVAGQDAGVVNHDSGANWTIKYDYFHDNPLGAAVMGGTNEVIQYDCIASNGQYGMNDCCGAAATGISNVVIDHNEVANNDTANYDHAGGPGGGANCGCAGGIKFWNNRGFTVTNNWVHDNGDVGLWADTNNVGGDFENNYIANNWGEGLMYEASYNAYIYNNYLTGNAIGAGQGAWGGGFPMPAVYISESGADSRVSPTTCGTFNCGSTLDISNNTLVDNWGGVVLWESANRYCGVNPSADCPLGNPSIATVANCTNGSLLPTTPYIDDCRWKTQNVKVHNNVFTLDQTHVTGCTHTTYMCGYNGLMSNYGLVQTPNDPYLGTIVATHLTYGQNNSFSNNTYSGYWCFDPFYQGNSATYSTWRTGPGSGDPTYWGATAYDQDSNATDPNPNTSC
jgi:hypothetical protein